MVVKQVYDFNSLANVKNDRDESRMASGRLFQVHGPAMANRTTCHQLMSAYVPFNAGKLVSIRPASRRLHQIIGRFNKSRARMKNSLDVLLHPDIERVNENFINIHRNSSNQQSKATSTKLCLPAD